MSSISTDINVFANKGNHRLPVAFKIRAGMIKNLRVELSRIFSTIIKELAIRNGIKDIIEKYLIVEYMKANKFFGTNIDLYADPIELFGNQTNTMLKYLLPLYDYDDICRATYLYFDLGIIYNINVWRNIVGNSGTRMEGNAIKILGYFGINIIKVARTKHVFEYNGLNIELHGTPDGIIDSSLGNVIKQGTIVEIKYKHTTAMNTYSSSTATMKSRSSSSSDEYQLCAYGIIFAADVLYVKIYENNYMDICLYTYEQLKSIWDSVANVVLKNCYTLHKLFSSVYDDEMSLKRIIAMI